MLKRRVFKLLLISVALLIIWSLARQTWRLYQAGRNINLAQQSLDQLRIENEQLKARLTEVKSQEFIEKEAKNKLNYVREGEVVVVLPQTHSPESNQTSQINQKPVQNWQKWYWAIIGQRSGVD